MIKILFVLFFVIPSHSNLQKATEPKISVTFKTKKVEIQTKELTSSAATKNKQTGNNTLKGDLLHTEYLVKKLDYVIQTFPKKYSGKTALKLRLAHMLSLLAEQKFVQAESEKCKNCKKEAQNSAKRSLTLYKELDFMLSQSHLFLHTEALFKQAYLERLLGNKQKSLLHLKMLIKKPKVKPLFLARAWYNIGDIQFESFNYSQSLQAFNQVLKIQSSPLLFKASYGKIWSLFNLALYDQSLNELILFLSSDLYAKAIPEDTALKQKLEKELIALYSYAPLQQKHLEFLYHFVKQDTFQNTNLQKQQRLTQLAKQLNQLGRLKESNQVWKTYLSKAKKLQDQLYAYSMILANDLILNPKDKLTKLGNTVEKIFDLQKQISISSIDSSIKQFFNQMDQARQMFTKTQKDYLFLLYQNYNLIFPENTEIFLLTARFAGDLKKYSQAVAIYQQLVLNLNKTETLQLELKEKVCVQQIQMAELSKNEKQRLKAYNFYIQQGQSQEWIFKAKYQKAYIYYSNKNFKTASQLFYDLAFEPSKKVSSSIKDMQLKSSHLLLSALNKIGNQEDKLISYAKIFSKNFPKNKQEFTKIYNLAILNYVKKLVADKDFSNRPILASQDKNILKAWEILNLFYIKLANKSELEAYYLNRLLLAKELLRFEDMDKSLKFLISYKGLKKEDKKIVLIWKLWLAELRFDFKTALKLVKALNPSSQSKEHLLQLVRLSELAGVKSIPYYKTFIEKYPNSFQALEVLISMLEQAKIKQQKEILIKYATLFENNKEQLIYWVLKIDKGEMDQDFIKVFTAMSFMKDSFLNTFFDRKQKLDLFESQLLKVRSYSLDANLKTTVLNRELKNYSSKINRLEQNVSVMLQTKDWLTQFYTIANFKHELKRFYLSIINLPLPKNLTVQEQKEYKELLKTQMQAYQKKLIYLDKNLEVLKLKLPIQLDAYYKKTVQLKQTLKFLKKEDIQKTQKKYFVFYPYLKWEMQKLNEILDGKNKQEIQVLLLFIESKTQVNTLTTQVKEDQIQQLYENLKLNPFDKKNLLKLLKLEEQRHNKVRSFYLANRIKELKQKRDRL